MSATPQQIYSAPFDAVAGRYDDSFSSSEIGRAQRTQVWRALRDTFHPGDYVLEIGCGTGIDACFLAERDVRVFACDSSAQMIAVARQRVWKRGLQHFIEPFVLAAEQLSTLPAEATFDGAFSNFGALNCIDDLQQFARDLTARVKPGANVVLCWIGPFCLWETAWYLAHRNRRKAFRRMQPDGVSAVIAAGTSIQVRYPTVRQIAGIFAPQFRVKMIRGVGVAVPPSYVEDWVRHHRGLFRFFEHADTVLGRCPGVRLLADHVLVGLQRESTEERAEAEKP
jgi:ubiquinone/menaquinone biosynthesis C-methylase UbiE